MYTPLPGNRQLGKHPAVKDDRVPHFSLVEGYLSPPPRSFNWYAGVGDWTELANDLLGDCVQAASLHALQQFSRYAGKPLVPTDQDAIDFYSKSQGYVPGDPSTDNGSLVMGPTGTMQYWLNTGITCGGVLNKVTSYMQLATPNVVHWKQGIWAFGGLMFGFRVPAYIMAGAPPYVWDVQPTADQTIVGGHEIWVDGYLTVSNETFFDFISWGERFRMTEAFMMMYVDEVVVMYNKASLNEKGVDARGLPEAMLLHSMAALKNEG